MATKSTKTEAPAPSAGKGVITSRSGIVTIPGIKLEQVSVLIVGTAPLIVHKFSEKAQRMILDKHMGVASAGREKKDPHANFLAARHRLADMSDGFPAGGLKACIVSGCDKAAGLARTVGKGAMRIKPDCEATNLIRIITPFDPDMREDMVRNETGVVDIRHRPEYYPWAMLLRLEYLPQKASVAQVLQAVEMAGFTVGIGEWRPASKKSLSGSFGTFRVANEAEVSAFEDGKLFADYRRPVQLAAE
jgi:hypothetical protein